MLIYNEDCRLTLTRGIAPDLILFSPPYNIGKEYEVKTSLDNYSKWLLDIINDCYNHLNEKGSICIQLGNYIDKGAVYPLDCLLFNDIFKIGFIPRNRIVWTFGHGLHCKNRFSGRHETILWFTKSKNYTFNLDPVRVPSKYPGKKHFKGPKKGQLSGNPLGKNPTDVWDITNVKNNHPEKTSHPCQFPLALCDRLILSLTNEFETVYDPFGGAGTTILSAKNNNRIGIMSELDNGYCDISRQRIS